MQTKLLITALLAFSTLAHAGQSTKCHGSFEANGSTFEVTYEAKSFFPCVGPCPGAPEYPPKVLVRNSVDGKEEFSHEPTNQLKNLVIDEQLTEYSLTSKLDATGEPIMARTPFDAVRIFRSRSYLTAQALSKLLPENGVEVRCEKNVSGSSFKSVKN